MCVLAYVLFIVHMCISVNTCIQTAMVIFDSLVSYISKYVVF